MLQSPSGASGASGDRAGHFGRFGHFGHLADQMTRHVSGGASGAITVIVRTPCAFIGLGWE